MIEQVYELAQRHIQIFVVVLLRNIKHLRIEGSACQTKIQKERLLLDLLASQ